MIFIHSQSTMKKICYVLFSLTQLGTKLNLYLVAMLFSVAFGSILREVLEIY